MFQSNPRDGFLPAASALGTLIIAAENTVPAGSRSPRSLLAATTVNSPLVPPISPPSSDRHYVNPAYTQAEQEPVAATVASAPGTAQPSASTPQLTTSMLSDLIKKCMKMASSLHPNPGSTGVSSKDSFSMSDRPLPARGQPPLTTLRGVTFHQRDARWEAQVWVRVKKSSSTDRVDGEQGSDSHTTGKQVYLGSFLDEETAGLAYDIAAYKTRGDSARTNFSLSDSSFDALKAALQHMTFEDVLASLRAYSGMSRGKRPRSSQYRGVSRHRKGKWEARVTCQTNKHKYKYLGLFNTEEEAAKVYDQAVVAELGPKAKTNFPIQGYLSLQLETEHQSGVVKTRKRRAAAASADDHPADADMKQHTDNVEDLSLHASETSANDHVHALRRSRRLDSSTLDPDVLVPPPSGEDVALRHQHDSISDDLRVTASDPANSLLARSVIHSAMLSLLRGSQQDWLLPPPPQQEPVQPPISPRPQTLPSKTIQQPHQEEQTAAQQQRLAGRGISTLLGHLHIAPLSLFCGPLPPSADTSVASGRALPLGLEAADGGAPTALTTPTTVLDIPGPSMSRSDEARRSTTQRSTSLGETPQSPQVLLPSAENDSDMQAAARQGGLVHLEPGCHYFSGAASPSLH